MIEPLSIALCAAGAVFWIASSLWLFTSRPVLVKLHYIGIADTYGSLLIIAGLLLRSDTTHHLLVMAAGSCVFWGAGMAVVVAHRIGDETAHD